MFEVKTRQVPEQQVLGIRRHVVAPKLPAYIDEAFSEIRSQLERAGLPFASAPFVIYYGLVSEAEDGPVEVCVPFEGEVTPAGEARVRREPQREEAYVTLSGAQAHYPEILRAQHEAVTAWAREGGRVLIGAAREVYFSEERRPDEPFCDVAYR